MKQMRLWGFLFLSSFCQVSYLRANDVLLPLSGIHSGEDLELFTLRSSSPTKTTYSLRKDFIVCDFAGNSIHKPGAAFLNLKGDLFFINSTPLAALTFKNIHLGARGAGLFSESNVTFKGLHSLVLENNESWGGVLTTSGDLSFINNTSVLCQNNISYGPGGALLLQGRKSKALFFRDNRGTILFLKNKAVNQDESHPGYGGAVSSISPGSPITFADNQEILFQENEGELGGAIYNDQGAITFENNFQTTSFFSNKASFGGAVYSRYCNLYSQWGDTLFTKNAAAKVGGAIHADYVHIRDCKGSIVFEENSATAGGAIAVNAVCDINAQGPVRFINNSALGLNGGAIYMQATGSILRLHANQGDIEFCGNKVRSQFHSHINSTSNFTNNAITIQGAPREFSLSANEGHRICFYDPIISATENYNSLYINHQRLLEAGGAVIFSGARLSPEHKKENKNKTSIINQPVRLCSGVLSIEGGAILAVRSFYQEGGLLALGPGSKLTTQGKNSEKDKIVITNLGFNLENLDSSDPAEIRATEKASIEISGVPRVYGHTESFYENHEYASKPYTTSIILSAKKLVTAPSRPEKDIQNLIIAESEYMGYGYQGSWEFSWSPNDTKEKKTIIASWTPTGEFSLDPKRRGSFIPTTLWSTFSGLNIASNIVNNNYLNNSEVIPLQHLCVFGGPVYQIMEQNPKQSSNNLLVQHAGHNVGARIPFSFNTILSAALTQLFSSSSQQNVADKSHAQILIGTVSLNKSWQALSLRSSFSYTEDSQVMKHVFPYKGTSRGSWRNYGWSGSVGMSYAYPKGIRYLKMTPFVDLQYTKLVQNPFVETGYDPRYFSSSEMTNLSLPIGIALEMRFIGSRSSLFLQVSTSYIKDLRRVNPQSSASLVLNHYTWDIQGVPLGKEALNITLNSTIKYKIVTAYMGISSTQREGSNLSANAHAGLSLSF
ncbi:Omp11 [Chlamydia pneumoniae TW-183]|uniref:Probable outer membrane protein pmp19 n=3 Tax=Chlamydia pneumoniae TaxID=83558 RepID=PMP19_CHLPN|nr:polymorphic outer membrane protein middle domain-containing protein [Chlamydia pneumoniae]Q9Z813.1 RecName: Full=Probable outer membrane protein pmp19; AltName: Full=Polymorphic membrane protein 19; Flags: Precursor [Chlamydia pneumoniae]AAD18679.1 polymorphic membrane protein A Family [Chlamydia pneumoniae CWL029]AAF38083.1 polymorphic membrane protein A family [Chlamydia pneumoniae AR39]AAP98489.1 Omp11 [Chlamydia pneumoniae TW-183]CRI33050.1 Probable outer membrane protein pmp19 [Chlamyd